MATERVRWAMVAALCLLALSACGDDEQAEPEAGVCERGDSRCRGQVQQVCEDGQWTDAVDCSLVGGRCFVSAGGADCVGVHVEPDAGTADGGEPDGGGTMPVLPPPDQTFYEPCDDGQAYDPVARECVRCPFSACDGRGEDGLFEGTTRDGKCVCRTQDGYYRPESGQLSVPCDKDGDGWVSVEARSSIESQDRAYRDNARCHLRTIDRVVLEAEGAAEGQGHVVLLEDIDPLVPELALYEMEVLDDQARLLLDDKVKAYGGGKPPATTLNSFTKACVDAIADFNANDVPDVEEWDEYDEPVELWATFPELVSYARFAYFMELHTGWFELDTSDGLHEYGSYHIRERSRLVPPGQGGVPLAYYNLRRGDDVRWYEHADHWQVCDRQTDAAFSPDAPARGMDFARYNEGLWNLSSRGGTGNLLESGDGEGADSEPWTAVVGPLEIAAAGDCGAPAPREGDGFLALGGLCEPAVGNALATQRVDVPPDLIALAQGGEPVQVAFGGFLSNGNGADRPAMQLRYYSTAAGHEQVPDDALGDSELLWTTAAEWTARDRIEVLPPGTRSLLVRLTAQRLTATNRNDGYFDGLYLRFLSSAPNLVVNPGAELAETQAGARMAQGWQGDRGPATSGGDPECEVSDEARSGLRFFGVGGCAGERLEDGRVSQTVDVADYEADIAGGNVAAWFGAWVRAGDGGSAAIHLEFLDAAGAMLSASEPLSASGPVLQWRRLSGQASIPAETASIRLVLRGQRDDPAVETAVFDDVFLRLSTGARMFHHSQFKCVQAVEQNAEPEEHPERLTLGQLATSYELNDCEMTGGMTSPAEAVNPRQPLFHCQRPAETPREGTVGFASVEYLHYPLQDRPSYERGCVNECLAVGPDCSSGADPTSYYACKTDREYFGTTYCDCAGGYTPWPACDTCSAESGNWDPAKDCRQCIGNWDVLQDCAGCRGNWDPEQNCEVCRNHFRDVALPMSPSDTEVRTDECGTCPDDDVYGHWTGTECDRCVGKWDEEANCLECEGNWDIDAACEQCLPHFDPTADCETCLGNWDGDSCAVCRPNFDPTVDCVACLPNYRPEEVDGVIYCEACQGNWDPATGCQECLSGWDAETFCTSCLDGFESFVPLDATGAPDPNAEPVCIRKNLLDNGGAETLASVSGGDEGPPEVSVEPKGWAANPENVVEALYQRHCPAVDHIEPMEGLRFFNLGGACHDAPVSPQCPWEDFCSVDVFRWWFWWCHPVLVACNNSVAPLWAASQGISLEDIYAITSDPDPNVRVQVRLAAWVRREPGPTARSGYPTPTISLSGYRPNGDQTFKQQCTIPTGAGTWERVMTEPFDVAKNTFSLLFLMGGYLTPEGTDQLYFDDLQLRLCLGDRCDLEDENGQLNTCYRSGSGWDCDAGASPCMAPPVTTPGMP